MGLVKDTVIDNLDFDYDESKLDLIESKINHALEKLNKIEDLVSGLNKSSSPMVLVKKKSGHPEYKMYYFGDEISDETLAYLIDTQGYSVADINKNFYYTKPDKYDKDHVEKITDSTACKRFIYNRLNRWRANK